MDNWKKDKEREESGHKPHKFRLKTNLWQQDLETYQSLIIYSLQEIMIHMILWYKIMSYTKVK